jgi:hypothetical protein
MGIGLIDDERKKDDDYIRVVDGLLRFFNSQNTSHGGYLLTMAVIGLTISNLALSFNVWITRLLGWPEYVWPITIISVTLIGLYFAIEWMVARLQYYIALSEVALNHLPYTGIGPTGSMELYYGIMKTRALESPNPLGVRNAISRLFEARLYVSCQREKKKAENYELNEKEQETFHLSDYYSHGQFWTGLGPCYAKHNILWIWPQTNLLLKAYRKTLKSYEEGYAEHREVWNLFKEFIDC